MRAIEFGFRQLGGADLRTPVGTLRFFETHYRIVSGANIQSDEEESGLTITKLIGEKPRDKSALDPT